MLLCLFGPPSKTSLTVLPCRARGDMRQDSRPVVRLHFRHPTPEEHFKQSHTVSDRTADPRSEGGAPRKSASLHRNQRMSQLGCLCLLVSRSRAACCERSSFKMSQVKSTSRVFFVFFLLIFFSACRSKAALPQKINSSLEPDCSPQSCFLFDQRGRKHSVNLYRNCVFKVD